MDEEKGIDLDALEQAVVAPSTDIGGLAVVQGPKVSLFENKQQSFIDLTHLQLMYLIDVSLSMCRTFTGEECRLDTVKRVVGGFLQKHFANFPQAHASIWSFNMGTHKWCTWGTKDAVVNALKAMQLSGGTSLTQAVQEAVWELKRTPSPTKQNHIVMASDGIDKKAVAVEFLADEMVANNIVFDFILIATDSPSSPSMRDALDALKRTCKRTGGQFVIVNDALAFEQHLLGVSSRPCLPERKGA